MYTNQLTVFDYIDSVHPGTVITTILSKPDTEHDKLFALTLCNHPEFSGYVVLPLTFVEKLSDPVEEQSPVTYNIGNVYKDIELGSIY